MLLLKIQSYSLAGTFSQVFVEALSFDFLSWLHFLQMYPGKISNYLIPKRKHNTAKINLLRDF